MGEFLRFLDGPMPGIEIRAVYNNGLVFLSYLVASFAAATALELAARVRKSRGFAAAAWLGGGACAMGVGIWGMHFIGMLAFGTPIPVRYDLDITLLSLFAAILICGFALAIVTRKTLPKHRLIGGGTLMGLGVVVMHYTGMAAVRMDALILYHRDLFALSVLNAIICSTIALWLVFHIGAKATNAGSTGLKVAAALFMGLAIAGMHYTAMYAGICIAPAPVGSTIASLDATLQTLVIGGVAALFTSVILAVSIENQIIGARHRASERRLALIMDRVPAMIAHVDADERYSFVNRAYAQWIGEAPEALIGRSVASFDTQRGESPPGSASITPAAHGGMIAQRLAGGERVRYECAMTTAEGATRYADVEIVADLDEKARIRGYFVLANDVTHRREIEEELRAAKDAAESADKTKSRFLAAMSHEIRTPMNGVLGMAELLLDTTLGETQLRFAQGIHRSGNALLGIINDILDFSKIEAGRLDLDPVRFDLSELCDDVMTLLCEAARGKDIGLVCELEPTVPRELIGDALRIRQVLTNLVGNAVKFTERGGVSVRIARAPADLLQPAADGDSSIGIVVRVIDTGIGMDEATLQRMFSAFSQADASTTRRFGGTGLGLAISKQLVQMMGGAIGAESEPGIGSSFWFTVRVGLAAAADARQTPGEGRSRARPLRIVQSGHDATSRTQEQPAVASEKLRDARILLAEDNAVNREIAIAMLQALGCSVTCATDGLEAVERATRDCFDVVLMDCQMPGLDGFAATAAIRRHESVRPNAAASDRMQRLPIVALTANAMRGDRDQCIAAGMDDYLPKPFNRQQLEATLARWVQGRAGAAEKMGTSEQPVPADDPTTLDPAALDAIRDLECPGQPPLVGRIVSAYRSESPKLVTQIQHAVRSGDVATAARAAHSLRSSSANLGAIRLADLCNQIETDARKQSIALASTLLDALELEHRKVTEALRSAA